MVKKEDLEEATNAWENGLEVDPKATAPGDGAELEEPVKPGTVPGLVALNYLCNFEGLVEPRVISEGFEGPIPDEVIIKAMGEIDEEDLLFGLSVTFDDGVASPRLWAFGAETMDELREKAGNG